MKLLNLLFPISAISPCRPSLGAKGAADPELHLAPISVRDDQENTEAQRGKVKTPLDGNWSVCVKAAAAGDHCLARQSLEKGEVILPC